ncbi:DNA-binding response regulator, OmpR family, contains REC and winged-helix (wHTH) domain [Limimonas halophila]|uniref:DNA-binding response regulator, OmpR family, contains REC and winged-helix (WHTH) domain n=1 Tax=Limimonas halophila TaxID=1082479 RepID=A0A1G7T551_9PROT|nr:response regulator transcription factor [Limimonas halophila]SDG30144.1 DNA-binding response regulator, OmpR family, contains REC and winged-helix (wHTH) domain [Limimonas halophila]
MATTPRTLLLVDPDAGRRSALAATLRLHEEFAVTEAGDLAEAEALAAGHPFDAVLLDAGDAAPADGVAVLRRGGLDAVIVALADVPAPETVEAALDAGALDCVDRAATGVPVLVARLRAHLRAHDRRSDAPVTVGPVQLRPWPRLLVNVETGRRVQLTEKEMGLLRILFRAGQTAVTRRDLLDAVWHAHPAVETHTVETHVYRLRQKLAAAADGRVRIETAGGGYRLAVDSAPVPASAA